MMNQKDRERIEADVRRARAHYLRGADIGNVPAAAELVLYCEQLLAENMRLREALIRPPRKQDAAEVFRTLSPESQRRALEIQRLAAKSAPGQETT